MEKKNFLDNLGSHRQNAKVRHSLFSNLHNAVYSKKAIFKHSSVYLFHLWAMLCGKHTKGELIHVTQGT